MSMNRISRLAIASLLVVFAHVALATVSASDPRLTFASQPHRGPIHVAKHGQANSPAGAMGKQSRLTLAPRGGIAAPPTTVNLLTATVLSAGGSNYYRGVIGDFNHDGRKDLATVISNNFGATYSLSVLL